MSTQITILIHTDCIITYCDEQHMQVNEEKETQLYEKSSISGYIRGLKNAMKCIDFRNDRVDILFANATNTSLALNLAEAFSESGCQQLIVEPLLNRIQPLIEKYRDEACWKICGRLYSVRRYGEYGERLMPAGQSSKPLRELDVIDLSRICADEMKKNIELQRLWRYFGLSQRDCNHYKLLFAAVVSLTYSRLSADEQLKERGNFNTILKYARDKSGGTIIYNLWEELLCLRRTIGQDTKMSPEQLNQCMEHFYLPKLEEPQIRLGMWEEMQQADLKKYWREVHTNENTSGSGQSADS